MGLKRTVAEGSLAPAICFRGSQKTAQTRTETMPVTVIVSTFYF